MAKIILQGKLGQEFKKEWNLSVKTPQEAVRALEANTQGKFSEYLQKTALEKNVGYKFVVDKYEIVDQADTVLFNKILDDNSIIEIIPTVGGRAIITYIIVQVVISVISSVISALLAPSPEVNLGSGDGGEGPRKESFLFNGREGAAKQGNPIPVGYGRMLVPSIPISLDYIYKNALEGSGGSSFYPPDPSNYENQGDYWKDYYKYNGLVPWEN